MSRRYWFLWVLVGLLALAGCSGGMLGTAGTVTLDGTPLPDGDIKFVPNDKTIGAEGSKIKDGKYQVKLKPGSYKVEIRAVRVVPGQKGPMGDESVSEQYIPKNYNDQTELKADIGQSSETKNFELKLK